MRVILSLILFFASFHVEAIIVDVRIFSGDKISSFIFYPVEGRYQINDLSGEAITEVRAEQQLQLILQNNSILLSKDGILLGSYPSIEIQGKAFWNSFCLAPVDKGIKPRTYDADLICIPNNGQLKIINRVPIEAYIAGVVRSESGEYATTEFYKVQATISRTYALSSLNRHSSEGFHLCDQVHCQAYYGNSRFPKIIKAVDASRGDAIVDSSGRYITAAFHASCGGQTVNSEDVWTAALPYLRSRPDTFCSHHPTSSWEKVFPKKYFLDYLAQKFKFFPDSATLVSLSQTNRRIFLDSLNRIPLKTLRNDLGLRSTFFSISLSNDSIILKGKGYGHGVGLCQIGAMRMAELGFSYPEIIAFYYFHTFIKPSDE